MNAPKLRFKDENNHSFPKWKAIQLKSIISTYSGGTPNSKQKTFYTGKIPFIRSGEISSEFTELFINESGLENSSAQIVEKGDLLYALYGATSGEVAISKINGAINQAVLCIRTKESKYFLLHYLTLMKEPILSKYLQGGQGNLSAKIVKELDFYLPCIEEQQKIADFLTLLDCRIEQQQEKVDTWHEYQKGMMQKLFSQEFRFKDGNGKEFSEWKEKTLESLGKFSKGGGLSKDDLTDDGKPCILYGELYTLYDHVINKVYSQTKSNDKVVTGMKNDVLIPSSGETSIDIACASALEVEGVLLGGDINIFRPNENILGSFISYQINSVKKNELVLYAQGSSVVHLYNKEIKLLKIFLPSLVEQQKIANFLSEIDKKIKVETEKISTLKEQKKGFMQKMFV